MAHTRIGTLVQQWEKHMDKMNGTDAPSTIQAIPRAVHFHDNHRNILVFGLETGEM